MTRQTHILVVEDDRTISALVSRFLTGNGLRVSTAGNGRDMDRILKDSRVDLLVLDLMLPGEDGLSICRRVRAESDLPILMLTSKSEEIDRIVGLELGADDYLAKPFNPRELLARIRAILRRAGAAAAERPIPGQHYLFAGWTVSPPERTLVDPHGVRVQLTSAEFDLLVAFCTHPRRVLSRDQLLDLTQGRLAAPFERSVDILVSRLRQKIEADPRDPAFIKTVRASGYLFTPEVTS